MMVKPTVNELLEKVDSVDLNQFLCIINMYREKDIMRCSHTIKKRRYL